MLRSKQETCPNALQTRSIIQVPATSKPLEVLPPVRWKERLSDRIKVLPGGRERRSLDSASFLHPQRVIARLPPSMAAAEFASSSSPSFRAFPPPLPPPPVFFRSFSPLCPPSASTPDNSGLLPPSFLPPTFSPPPFAHPISPTLFPPAGLYPPAVSATFPPPPAPAFNLPSPSFSNSSYERRLEASISPVSSGRASVGRAKRRSSFSRCQAVPQTSPKRSLTLANQNLPVLDPDVDRVDLPASQLWPNRRDDECVCFDRRNQLYCIYRAGMIEYPSTAEGGVPNMFVYPPSD